MLVPQDIVVTLRFPVGRKFAIVTVQFLRGDDSDDVLRAFFVKEDVPVYLEASLLAAVHRLLQQDGLLGEACAVVTRPEAMRQHCRTLCERYSTTTAEWQRTDRQAQLLGSLAPTAALTVRERKQKAEFRTLFHKLCNSKVEVCERLIQAQQLQQHVMRKLVTLRQEELEDMHASQSEEMNKAMGSDQTNISSLVEKHVAELDELQAAYREKINGLKRQQVAKFREFVEQFANGVQDYAAFDPEDEQSKHDRKWARHWFKNRDEPEEQPETFDADGAEVEWQHASFTVSVGHYRPTLYSMELHAASAGALLRHKLRNRRALVTANCSLYGERLAALTVVTEPSAIHESASAAEVIEMAELSAEAHFEPMAEQLAAVQREATRPFVTGDYFITKHSNLGETQVVFHFVGADTKKSPLTEKSLYLAQDSPLLQGLRNVLEVCMQYDVSTLAIPLLLVDALPEHLHSHPACIARGLTVMHAIRSLLLGACDSTLKTVRLLLPPVSLEVFAKYQAALKNVFSVQL